MKTPAPPPAPGGGLSFFFLASLQRRLHEAAEQRVRLRRLRPELGVALHRHEPRVRRQLDRLHQLAVRAEARKRHAVRLELLPVLVVELVTVPVPLLNLRDAVSRQRPAALRQLARVRSQTHRTAHVRNGVLLVEQADDGVGEVVVDLRRVGVLQADHVAGEFDHRALQAQADAEERHALLPREADGLHLARDAAVAEAARNQDAVHAAQDAIRPLALDLLRLHLAHRHPALQGDAGVVQRFVDRFVGVVVLDVLADDRDGDFVGRVEDALQHRPPVADVQRTGRQVQLLDDQLVQPVLDQAQRHLVNAHRLVALLDHRPPLDVAKQSDFIRHVLRHLALGAADEDVGLDADLAKLADGVLGRLGLGLAGRLEIRDQRQVDVEAVVLAHVQRKLADRLQERQTFNVADRAADLGDDHVHVGARPAGSPPP